MPNNLDVPGALALLRTRDELIDGGSTERQVRGLVESGHLRRVRRGRYVFEDDWKALWNEGRHLVEVVAAHLNAERRGPVFWGPSAAVLLGLPLYRTVPRVVHVATVDSRHGRTQAGTTWHNVEVDAADIVTVDGLRCTSMDRTVLDLARSTRPETGIGAADAALRRAASAGRHQDDDRTREWLDRMSGRAERLRGRGVRQARRVVAFADGRAELPGESVSRLQLSRLGFSRYDLQKHVIGSAGNDYWLDFAFHGSRCFGEFDGKGKYVDPDLRGERTIEQVVIDEKRREDDIRGVTGWRMVRWESKDIVSPEVFGVKLAAFGLRPPG